MLSLLQFAVLSLRLSRSARLRRLTTRLLLSRRTSLRRRLPARSTYLPYGADTLGIVGEYYWIARERGTIEAARNRASCPLRYPQAGERHEVTVRVRRNTPGGLGSTWAIDKVEPSTK